MKVKILQIIPAPEGLLGVTASKTAKKGELVHIYDLCPIALALVQAIDDPTNTFVDGIGADGRPFCDRSPLGRPGDDVWYEGMGWGDLGDSFSHPYRTEFAGAKTLEDKPI